MREYKDGKKSLSAFPCSQNQICALVLVRRVKSLDFVASIELNPYFPLEINRLKCESKIKLKLYILYVQCTVGPRTWASYPFSYRKRN